MVAYSFKAAFAPPILARTKDHTLRNDRKRHARVGETLQLYTGMRTRQCRLLGEATCLEVDEVRLTFRNNGSTVELTTTEGAYTAFTGLEDLHAFALRDGFASWPDLRAFWAREHVGLHTWTGVRIVWGGTFEAAR